MEKFKDKLDFELLLAYQKLSKEFIKKYKHKFTSEVSRLRLRNI